MNLAPMARPRPRFSNLHLFRMLLASLTRGVPEEPQGGPGRPRVPLADRLYVAVEKVYMGCSARDAMGFHDDAHEHAYISTPGYINLVSRTLNDEQNTALLQDLVSVSALPLAGLEQHFAIDSSGFTLQRVFQYNKTAHPKRKRDDGEPEQLRKEHDYLKLHVSVGTVTCAVAAAIVTGSRGAVGDSTHFDELLQRTVDAGFNVKHISADKAYASRANHEAARQAGATLYTPFPNNRRFKKLGSQAYYDAQYFFLFHREKFNPLYHRRSLVESTFSSIKQKLGEELWSKKEVARTNELYCKVIAHNLGRIIAAAEAARIDLHEIFPPAEPPLVASEGRKPIPAFAPKPRKLPRIPGDDKLHWVPQPYEFRVTERASKLRLSKTSPK